MKTLRIFCALFIFVIVDRVQSVSLFFRIAFFLLRFFSGIENDERIECNS